MAPEEARGSPCPRRDLGGVPAGLYHERQRLELCALHALNNLLQRPWLSKAQADGICRHPLERLSLPHILGFLLNVPSRVTLGALALPLARPHWLGVRRLGDTFYNLDSKLAAPAAIGAEPQLREFLRAALAKGPSELFVVVPREVEEAGTWLSPE
ncbi:josephin-2-like isoform X2 [Chamaea fasciata]|uniref:josephin-2-like isoform X2 n=1 Tax=Chamaea fasciata TaxID=190680 RepID=UPI00336AB8A4